MADASNLYEQNTTSSTYGGYGEGDMEGGGEQIASAIYVNEQFAAQAAVVLTKQNAVVLQPTNPPINPALNDMWIDTGFYPNIIYTWDGAQWVKATVTNPEEIGTYDTATVDTMVNNVQMATDDVSDRTTIVEGQIADGTGLFTTIKTSTEYQTDVGNRAQDVVDGFVDSLQDDATIAAKLPKLAKQSDLQQTASDLTAKFSSGGGVNLLKNSSAYGIDSALNLLQWQVITGSATQYIGSDCVMVGAGISIVDGKVQQAVGGIAGEPYTLTMRVKKGVDGTAWFSITDGQQAPVGVNYIATQAYDYVQMQVAGFIPNTGTLLVEIGASGATGGAIFTEIMLNKGTVGLQWSHANGENYNEKISFDINGIKVASDNYDGYTVMSPQEFSGYYRNNKGVMQKIFTLNGQYTEVAKLRITDPNAVLEMGSIQVIYTNGNGLQGWAFVPTTG